MVRKFYELIPGALAWATIVLMFVLSRYIPAWVSIFIILFDIYWVLKTIYMSLHLRATFRAMRENLVINWYQRLRGGSRGYQEVLHLVILPMYNEPYEVIRESFSRLAAVNYPKEKIFAVLAIEARAGEAGQATAAKIKNEFAGKFGDFLVSTHPAGLPNEIPGKGSNESWAAIRAKEEIIDRKGIDYKNIITTVLDADSQVFPEYFGRLTYVFLNREDGSPRPETERLRTIYQPIPLFTNNIHEAPSLARVVAFSATFWQMMQQSRPERLTSFSSQSIPFSTLVEMGFWNKDIVSEDSRIFWQGYLHYHSDFRAEPLFYPVSMDANVAPTFWQSMKNLYKQQRRWGWGCENIPYMFEGFSRDPLIPRSKKWYWSFNVLEGFHSWATNSLMIFALGWLPLMLGGHAFNSTLLSFSLPNITRLIMSISTIGIASSAILAIVLLPPRRTAEVLVSGEADGNIIGEVKKTSRREKQRSRGMRWYHYLWYFVEWALMPITLIIFGAIPGLEAQTRMMIGGRFRLGFWVTPKGRYKIS